MEAAIILLSLLPASAGESNQPARLTGLAPPPAAESAVSVEDRPLARSAAVTGPESKAVRPASPGTSGSLWRGLAALAAVLGLIGTMALVLRRLVPRVRRYSSGLVEILARTYFSSKHSVVLVRVGERAVLVGVSPDHVSRILSIDDPVEVARLASQASGDRDKLPSQTFDRFVHEEAAAYAPDAEEGRGETGAGVRDPFRSRRRSGLNDLLTKVKAAVQQV